MGAAGELHIGGAGLARGYLGRPGLTAEVFVPDPFAGSGRRLYRTGDRVRLDASGRLRFLGRTDFQLKLRGYRIELGEIESRLEEHPGVARAVVLAEPETSRLVAFRVARSHPSATLTELRAYLASHLPDYMVPAVFVSLEELPRTPSGKVDRKALAASLPLSEAGGTSGSEAPRTPLEEALVEIWSQVLRRHDVGIRDDFFDLGGHSLLATRALSRVRETLEVELSLRELFAHPTVASLAAIVSRRRTSTPAKPPLVPVDRGAELPLSFAQQRLWFLDRLEGGDAYKLPLALRLSGQLEVPAMAAGLTGVVNRHEALRTRFPARAGEPRQEVTASSEVALPVVDLGALPSEPRQRESRRLAAEWPRRPFDLARGPMLRTALLRLGEEDHGLLVTLHHIAGDAWSLGVFLEELATRYGALASGELPTLPPLAVQYPDFAAWQRNWLHGEVLERQLAFWRDQLAGGRDDAEAPDPGLPTDRPRPPMRTFRGAAHPFTVADEVRQELKKVAREQGATLAMTLQAAFKMLLSKLSRQSRVTLGSPVANRTHRELEDLIGLFANTLVLRTDLSGSPSFAALLGRERSVSLAAYDHQDLPFERLVEELDPERDLARNPLFQVLFVVQNAPREPLSWPGLELRPFRASGPTAARFDLELYLAETARGLGALFVYNPDLYDATTAGRMSLQLKCLLAAVVEAPEARLSELSLLSAAQRHQLESEWNDSAPSGPATGVHELFLAQASRAPEAVAAEDDERRLSYRGLNERMERLAAALCHRGVGPESRVGLCAARGVEMLVGVLGILRAGGAYVPLDPDLPAERLTFMSRDAGLSALVTEEEAAEVPAVKTLLASFSGPLVRLGSEPVAPLARDRPEVDPDQLAYVIFTSGSTGRPKGVQVPHRTVVNFLRSMAREPGMGRGDTLLAVTTLSFDISVLELLLPLAVGGRVVLAARDEVADGRRLAARLAAARASLMQATPAGWRLLLESGWRGDRRLKMLCGGEALPRRLAGELLSAGGELWNLYGPTETTVWSSVERLSPGAGEVTIGRPIADTRLAVLDRCFEPVPPGVEGELAIGGAGVARGYRRRPGLTAERFVPDPWGGPGSRLYRTGDRVRRAADGRLGYLGRLDHQVKLRGHRIELGEVEAVLEEHPAVARAVALVHEESADDHRLTVFWMRRGDAVASAAELRAHLRTKLPEHSVPGTLIELDALPLSPAGKVDRRRLAASRPPEAEDARVAPRSSTERQLVHLWERLLQREAVGVRDDFFELGGHSLLAVRLFAWVEQAFGVTLPIAALFRAPTVERLAELLHDPRRRDFRSSVVMICSGDDRPPFFCVPGYPGDPFIFRHLVFHLEADQPVYGFLAPGIDGETSPLTRVEDMAAHYLRGMKSVQPRGPYYLGGLCFGGSVAFEMARRLVAEGEDVALLALFDPYVNTRLLSLYFRWLGLRRRVRLHAGQLRDRRWHEALYYVAKKAHGLARRLGAGSAGETRKGPEVVSEDVVHASLQADRKYRPGPYPGRVTVFRGEGGASSRFFNDPASGWGRFAGGGVELHHVRGIHQRMFDEPHVQELAEKLYECLDRARIAAPTAAAPTTNTREGYSR